MTPEELKQWRFRLEITQDGAARLLGVHRVTMAKYETGVIPIDRPLALATLSCELAYIAADRYLLDHPLILNNIGAMNMVAVQAS